MLIVPKVFTSCLSLCTIFFNSIPNVYDWAFMWSFVKYRWFSLKKIYYKGGLLAFNIGSGSVSSNCKDDSSIMYYL